jgi:hypothetical protein
MVLVDGCAYHGTKELGRDISDRFFWLSIPYKSSHYERIRRWFWLMVVPSVITMQTRSFRRRLSGGLGSWISLIKYSVHNTLKPFRNYRYNGCA